MRVNLEELTENQAWEMWHQHLESGVEKHTGELVNADNHESRCCLGHLCHILELPLDKEKTAYEGYRISLPRRVQELMNISAEVHFVVPIRINGKRYQTITDVNDESDTPFSLKEISDILRSERDRGNLHATYENADNDPGWEYIATDEVA